METGLVQQAEDTELNKENDSKELAEENYDHLDDSHPKLSANNYVFGLLLQARKEKKYRILSLDRLPLLYLSPEENAYYFSGTEQQLLQYCLATPQKVANKVLSRAKFNKALKMELSELEQRRFDSLISYAIIHVAQGQLLSGHSVRQQLKLTKVPDFNANPLLSKYQSIAEFMYQNEVSLFDVAEKLQIPTSDVFDFYNVCYSFGYIKVLSAGLSDSDNNKNSKTMGRFLSSFFKK